jgi:ABC-type phosphate transport system substrate-binding protein
VNKIQIARRLLQILTLLSCTVANAADIVVVGNPQGAILTRDQILDVYLGKSEMAKPFDQSESATIRTDFYKRAVGKEPTQIKAIWARIMFTGKGQPPKEVADSEAVKKAVAGDPKAIGYIDKSSVDASVRVLAGFE